MDIIRCQVNGKGFRSRTSEFSALGPGTQWPGKNGSGSLWYPAKGLQLDFEFDQFVAATIFLARPSYHSDQQLKPFQGSLLRAGAPISLNAGDAVHDIVAVLGPPVKQDDDEDETALHYAFGDVRFELEIDKSSGLEVINIVCEGDVKPR